MDQYLSAVIVALITGVFSVITLIIQKKNNEIIDKIDEQSSFIDREKKLRKSLNEKTAEREALMDEIMMLILETNLCALNSSSTPSDIFTRSEELQRRFNTLNTEIAELNKEYNMMLEISQEYAESINKK